MGIPLRRLDPTFVRAQIDLLRATHPDIWDDGDDVLLSDSLEAETDLHAFLSRVVRRMIEAQAFTVSIDLVISDLRVRKERMAYRGEVMRELAFSMLQWAEIKNVELPEATLGIRAGHPKVIITDEAAIPDRLCRIKREPDKLRIREFLEHGSVGLAGAELSNAQPVLTVRIK